MGGMKTGALRGSELTPQMTEKTRTYMAPFVKCKARVLDLGHVGWTYGKRAHARERCAPDTARMSLGQEGV